jgi:DNA-nicking Smr family endonuclease
MSRARRVATDEERALFHETFAGAKPLRRSGITAKEARRPPDEVLRTPPPPRLPMFAHGEAPPIGGHRDAQLRRGRIAPEARIDLHGLTREEAYRALVRFLGRSRGLDHRVVLVITGKSGVLKEMLPAWLAQPELALIASGIAPAHVRHGGVGAFYVSLKRQPRLR